MLSLQNLRQTLDDLTRNGYSVVSMASYLAYSYVYRCMLLPSCILNFIFKECSSYWDLLFGFMA